MEMRRDWPNMPEKNRKELEHILLLLKKDFDFNIAILYGRYVDGQMRGVSENYELLLLTNESPQKEGWELEAYVKKEYPVESRVDWGLHIETAHIVDFNQNNAIRWFYWNIRKEGTIIYDDGKAKQGICARSPLKCKKAYQNASYQYNYFFTSGSILLDDAERLWTENQPALAALALSYAVQFLLRAEESVFYGNFINPSDLNKSFRRVRVFSKRLSEEFKWNDWPEGSFFDHIQNLRFAPLKSIKFKLYTSRYNQLLRKSRQLQAAIRESSERHLFYLKHGKTKSQMEAEARAQVDPIVDSQRLSEPQITSQTEIPVKGVAGDGTDFPASPGAEDSLPQSKSGIALLAEIPVKSVAGDSMDLEAEDMHANIAQKFCEVQDVTIRVDPAFAVIALGLVKGYFPALIKQVETRCGLAMDDAGKQRMIETLEEIYNRCIENTGVQEMVDLFLFPKQDSTKS